MIKDWLLDFSPVHDTYMGMAKTNTEMAEWVILFIENGVADPRDALTEISAKFAEWREHVEKQAVQEYLKINTERPNKTLDC